MMKHKDIRQKTSKTAWVEFEACSAMLLEVLKEKKTS